MHICLPLLSIVVLLGQEPSASTLRAAPSGATLRIATFNVQDVRTADLKRPDHARLRAVAAEIQRLKPDILLLNEIAYDDQGSPGYTQGDKPGLNGQRFADRYLALPQQDGLAGIRFQAFMAPVNTGRSSGYDLDRNGRAATDYPPPHPAADGAPDQQTEAGRAYGNDCWGFGTFPGQYAMTLLVRDGLTILQDQVRTFRNLTWRSLPAALIPRDPQTGQPWYSDEAWKSFPLSSKSHWDVPVRLPNAAVLHVLCSHPTPPVFDGPEDRNGCRNHDEIRFWAEYLNNAPFIVDDQGRAGGLAASQMFVILGDLNADPDEGDSRGNPVGRFLLSHPRVQGSFAPKAAEKGSQTKLDPDDTAVWGLRVDYVLPSVGLQILDGGVLRHDGSISDHFPVWLDLAGPQ